MDLLTQINGRPVKVVYTQQQLQDAIRHYAMHINSYFEMIHDGSKIIIVGVLKGCTYFFADLTRQLNFPFEIDFVQTQSYRGETERGELALTKDITANIEGRTVLLIDDIYDSGHTMKFLQKHFLEEKKAKKVLLVPLFEKDKEGKGYAVVQTCSLNIEPGDFLVGYGLDIDEKYRQLPDVYAIIGD